MSAAHGSGDLPPNETRAIICAVGDIFQFQEIASAEVTVKVTYAVRYVPWFSRQYEEAKRFRFQRASNGHGYWAPAPLDPKWP